MAPTRLALALLVALALSAPPLRPAESAPEGTMTWGVHVTLASRWLDPAETEALVTPFLVLYAIHDAVVKPMTGAVTGPSLAESWTASRDGLVYDFVLRKNARFHNGDPVTADDVVFSLQRAAGEKSDWARFFKPVTKYTVVDAKTIKMGLDKPFTPML